MLTESEVIELVTKAKYIKNIGVYQKGMYESKWCTEDITINSDGVVFLNGSKVKVGKIDIVIFNGLKAAYYAKKRDKEVQRLKSLAKGE